MTQPVVLDTNALLLPVLDGTDLVEELGRLLGRVELVVPAPVLQELRTLQGGQGRTGRAARAAARIVERARVEPATLPGDDGVLEVARRLGAAVATNDRALQASCRAAGLTVVASRGEGRLFLPRR